MESEVTTEINDIGIIIYRGGHQIGDGCFQIWQKKATLVTFVLKVQHEDAGEIAVRDMEEFFRARGVTDVYLETDWDTVGFWERMGYRTPPLSSSAMGIYSMTKRLQPQQVPTPQLTNRNR